MPPQSNSGRQEHRSVWKGTCGAIWVWTTGRSCCIRAEWQVGNYDIWSHERCLQFELFSSVAKGSRFIRTLRFWCIRCDVNIPWELKLFSIHQGKLDWPRFTHGPPSHTQVTVWWCFKKKSRKRWPHLVGVSNLQLCAGYTLLHVIVGQGSQHPADRATHVHFWLSSPTTARQTDVQLRFRRNWNNVSSDAQNWIWWEWLRFWRRWELSSFICPGCCVWLQILLLSDNNIC